MSFQPIIQRTSAFLCLDCGKCTASCPLARVDLEYSPRRIVERLVFGEANSVLADPHLWSCMTCGLCSTRCPSGVDFSRFIIEMRAEAFRLGERGIYAHDGILHEVMRIQTMDLNQKRTGWVCEDMQVSSNSEVFYFSGCLPLFDVIFADLGFEALDIARSAVRLMNQAGVVPIVSENERCCGADLLLSGDVDSFQKLAELNVQTIKDSGATKVVFTCAECYNAFKTDYPSYVGQLPFEMMHLTELLSDSINTGEFAFESRPERVTYHDPCRMARYLHVHEPPRTLLTSVPDVQLVEMMDNRERSKCCGSTAWVNCGGCAKLVQHEKIRQARDTGAQVMLTTCPKCQIHLACASRQLDAGQTVEIADLVSWVAKALI